MTKERAGKKQQAKAQVEEKSKKRKLEHTKKDVKSSNASADATSVAKSDGKNPLLAAQTTFLNSLSTLERDSFFSTRLDPEKRAEIWTNQANLGEDLVNKYSWAIPDERAIRILRHFSPLVEVGCGANAYWCQLMKQSGIDVIGFDAEPESGGMIQQFDGGSKVKTSKFPVRRGGPEILASNEIRKSKRTLFLCYPDEGDDGETADADADDEGSPPKSLGAACLEHFQGQYVIHVGELVGDTLSIEQAPWGRSSSPAFQERLAAEFHCLLKVGLTNWLFSRDTISVWKRSEKCSIFFGAEDDDSDEEEVHYKHIPVEERLPVDLAAPCVAHLLNNAAETENAISATGAAVSSVNMDEDYSCPW